MDEFFNNLQHFLDAVASIFKHDGQTLYLVRETKSMRDFLKLCTGEADKGRCGQKHFEALGVRRTRHYLPVTLGIALELAATRLGPLSRLPERVLEQGLTKLRSALEGQEAEAVIGSEVVLIEMWAQKSRA